MNNEWLNVRIVINLADITLEKYVHLDSLLNGKRHDCLFLHVNGCEGVDLLWEGLRPVDRRMQILIQNKIINLFFTFHSQPKQNTVD